MDKGALAKADKEVLVEIVKFAQKQGLKGSKGGWKDFLNSHDRKNGYYSQPSDPSRRSPDTLIAFLDTFFGEEQRIISNILRQYWNHVTIMKYMQHTVDNGNSFQKLVRLTHEHQRYLARYVFPSRCEDLVAIPLGDISEAMKLADVIAVDCEMVLCQGDTEALVQVCAVDKNLEVKLNMLVKPRDPVVDYRTDITGIAGKDLEGVTTTLADAQNSLKKLLMGGTILVGHSLQNDLQALKIDYPLVIDTTHIFKYADTPLITPSLNNLCKSVLGYEIRKEGEPHNCVMDAKAAMKLVLAKLENGFDNPIEIERAILGNTEKLLLHKIPVEVSSEELIKLFLPKFDVEIEADIRTRGEFYATFAVFKDSNDADEAFLGVHGSLNKDSYGRPQKLVKLLLNSGKVIKFYIRKVPPCLPNNCNEEQQHSSQAETEFVDNIRIYPNNKVDKAHAGDGKFLCGCEHMEQIDRLKHELRQREDELYNLQKILYEYLEQDFKYFN